MTTEINSRINPVEMFRERKMIWNARLGTGSPPLASVKERLVRQYQQTWSVWTGSYIF